MEQVMDCLWATPNAGEYQIQLSVLNGYQADILDISTMNGLILVRIHDFGGYFGWVLLSLKQLINGVGSLIELSDNQSFSSWWHGIGTSIGLASQEHPGGKLELSLIKVHLWEQSSNSVHECMHCWKQVWWLLLDSLPLNGEVRSIDSRIPPTATSSTRAVSPPVAGMPHPDLKKIPALILCKSCTRSW